MIFPFKTRLVSIDLDHHPSFDEVKKRYINRVENLHSDSTKSNIISF